jgi:hypothetical protein
LRRARIIKRAPSPEEEGEAESDPSESVGDDTEHEEEPPARRPPVLHSGLALLSDVALHSTEDHKPPIPLPLSPSNHIQHTDTKPPSLIPGLSWLHSTAGSLPHPAGNFSVSVHRRDPRHTGFTPIPFPVPLGSSTQAPQAAVPLPDPQAPRFFPVQSDILNHRSVLMPFFTDARWKAFLEEQKKRINDRVLAELIAAPASSTLPADQ